MFFLLNSKNHIDILVNSSVTLLYKNQELLKCVDALEVSNEILISLRSRKGCH